MRVSISLKCLCEDLIPAEDIKVTRELTEMKENW